MIREWAEELAKPSEYNNGVAACPFALQALVKNEVKLSTADPFKHKKNFICGNNATVIVTDERVVQDLESMGFTDKILAMGCFRALWTAFVEHL